ncbi:MAG: hypothetical protein EAZ20_10890 [Bacteroidetes bacterium]|nr:MAG: hypothetical protein EAZ20_10890 [Bacteroidota bacterium]
MKNVNQDVFASFADAQMSKEEMKMVKGGIFSEESLNDGIHYTCSYGVNKEMKQSITGSQESFDYCATRVNCSCTGNVKQDWN